MNAARRDRIEERLVRDAASFDLESLMAALDHLDFRDEAIRFRGNPDAASPKGVVASVELRERPRIAVVTLNLGLVGARGILPSYFERIAESLSVPERLYEFIAFFEHSLLRDYVQSVLPERGRTWRARRDAQFNLLALDSASTLTWLFSLVFPELLVSVERAGLRVRTDAHALVTGQGRLDGSTVLGSTHDAGRAGFTVHLFTEDERTSDGRTWWEVGRTRLDRRVAPLLFGTHLLLEVALHVGEHESWARVAREGHLGYDRIQGARGPHQVWVHRDGAFSALQDRPR